MSANPVKVAERRKRELLAELKEINKFLEMAQKISDREISKPSTPGGTGGSGSRSQTGPKPALVIATTKEILSSAPLPMTRGALLTALKDRGLEITGTNPANTLGTTLSRSDDVSNVKGFGYWLRIRELPDDIRSAIREDREPSGEASGELTALH